jgi:hypothetical protein
MKDKKQRPMLLVSREKAKNCIYAQIEKAKAISNTYSHENEETQKLSN